MSRYVLIFSLAITLFALFGAGIYIMSLSHIELACHGTVAFNEESVGMEDPLGPIPTPAPGKKPRH